MPAGCSTTGSSLRALLLGLLDAPLDVADRLEILAQLRAVARAELAAAGWRSCPVTESRMLRSCSQPRQPRRRVGASRRRRTAARRPRADCSPSAAAWSASRQADRVRVGAAVADVARAGEVAAVERQLQRGELRLPGRAAWRRSGPSRCRRGSRRLSAVFGGTPVRNRVLARACTPVAGRSAGAAVSPLSTQQLIAERRRAASGSA